jgi:hypothetical protein
MVLQDWQADVALCARKLPRRNFYQDASVYDIGTDRVCYAASCLWPLTRADNQFVSRSEIFTSAHC